MLLQVNAYTNQAQHTQHTAYGIIIERQYGGGLYHEGSALSLEGSVQAFSGDGTIDSREYYPKNRRDIEQNYHRLYLTCFLHP